VWLQELIGGLASLRGLEWVQRLAAQGLEIAGIPGCRGPLD
jgi:hypothetical protein